MIHTQETKQQVDSNTCCKHVSVSGKNAQHSNWIFKARRQKFNILDRSKEVECWESNGKILICTPQLEILFQSNFLSHSNLLSSSPTFTSITLWFSVVSTSQPGFWHLSDLLQEAFVYMFMRVSVHANDSVLCVCVSVGYEKIKPVEGQLASLQTFLDLSV